MKPALMFRCEPPGGRAFEAAIIEQAAGIRVVSNRHGQWTDEPYITCADLFMPEQEFYDWDIREVSVRDVGDFNPYHEPAGSPIGGQFARGPGGGETWQSIANEALKKWKEANPRVHAATVALRQDIDQAMAEADKFTNMRDWYEQHRPLARKLFGEFEPLFEKFLSAASIQAAGSDNVNKAIDAFGHYMLGGEFTPEAYPHVTNSERIQYEHIVRGEPLSGEKVGPFHKALMGDWDQAPADRHMKALLFIKPNLSGGNRAQPEVTKAVVGAMAKRAGWKTAELQAALWCVQKAREEKGLAGTIFTYKKYLEDNESRVAGLMHLIRAFGTKGKRKDAVDDSTRDILRLLEAEMHGYRDGRLLMELIEEIHRLYGPSPRASDIRALLNVWRDYDPDQPRAPAGTEEGGQWIKVGSSPRLRQTSLVRNPDVRLPPRVDTMTGYGQRFPVYVNPTRKELEGIAEDSDSGEVRVLVDKAKNLYAWDADMAIHASIMNEYEVGGDDWATLEKVKGRWVAVDQMMVAAEEPDQEKVKHELLLAASRAKDFLDLVEKPRRLHEPVNVFLMRKSDVDQVNRRRQGPYTEDPATVGTEGGSIDELNAWARDAVITMGIEDEVEWAIGVSHKTDLFGGHKVAMVKGNAYSVGMPPSIDEVLHEPHDFHHNHPTGGSLSADDIAVLNFHPKMMSQSAHTHDGLRFTARIPGRTEANDKRYGQNYRDYLDVRTILSAQEMGFGRDVAKEFVSRSDHLPTGLQMSHAWNAALARQGVIEYEADPKRIDGKIVDLNGNANVHDLLTRLADYRAAKVAASLARIGHLEEDADPESSTMLIIDPPAPMPIGTRKEWEEFRDAMWWRVLEGHGGAQHWLDVAEAHLSQD